MVYICIIIISTRIYIHSTSLYIHIYVFIQFCIPISTHSSWITRKSYTMCFFKSTVIQNAWRLNVRHFYLSLLHPMPEVALAYGDTSFNAGNRFEAVALLPIVICSYLLNGWTLNFFGMGIPTGYEQVEKVWTFFLGSTQTVSVWFVITM